MPWQDWPKKDVAACDKPRGGGKQPTIRGFPNGVTHFDFDQNILCSASCTIWALGEVKHLSSRRKIK